MKVRFNKSILSHALDTVQRAAQAKITSNTNNGILIRAAEGRISFEANDYTIGIKTSCEAEILEPGDVVAVSYTHLDVYKRQVPIHWASYTEG